MQQRVFQAFVRATRHLDVDRAHRFDWLLFRALPFWLATLSTRRLLSSGMLARRAMGGGVVAGDGSREHGK